nr:reverse transcriptase domain-containing protein [Tanacetum cinerariifolium]
MVDERDENEDEDLLRTPSLEENGSRKLKKKVSFRVRPDATGRMSLSVIMKCTAAIRQLAYGTTPDAFDEYLQMSKRTAAYMD